MSYVEALEGTSAAMPLTAAPAPAISSQDEEVLLRHFIGTNADSYIRTWQRMQARDPSLRKLVFDWSYPTFFLFLPWALYRKMWKLIVIFLLLPIVVETVAFGEVLQGAKGAYLHLAIFAVAAGFAKSLYVQSAVRRIRTLRARSQSEDEFMAKIEGKGVSPIAAVAGSVLLVLALACA